MAVEVLPVPNQDETYFKSIVEHLGVGVAETAVSGAFRLLNPEFSELVQRPAEELRNLRLQDISHADDVPRIDEALAELAAGKPKSAVEVRFVRSGISHAWVHCTISAMRNPAGKALSVLVVAQDITRRKHLEENLREREEKLRQDAQELEQQLIASGRLVSLGELTASMAHEFNNPLGIVLGFTQDLLGEMDPADPNHRFLQIIDEEAKRCEKIVQDLLEFARPRGAEFVQTDISEVIKKTLDMVSSRLFKQKVEAMIQTGADLPSIHADPQQLQQVLANLCLNALDAMPEGGQLVISAELKEPDRLTIAVSDTGFGIEPESIQKIFQPFFTAKKRKGLGLGLSVCERIVKAHGGRIEVHSSAGQGTTFSVHLPISAHSAVKE